MVKLLLILFIFILSFSMVYGESPKDGLSLFDRNIWSKVPTVYECDIKPCHEKAWGYDTMLTDNEKELDKNNDYVKAIMYKGVDYKGKETRVFAWIGVPPCKEGEKLPAMVCVHGGGGTAFEAWVRKWNARGYAAIAMDTCGSYPLGEYNKWKKHPWSCNSSWGDFENINTPLKDQWTYHAVNAILLGHSLLRNNPNVDENRVGITGISWGGYLTCICASLDDRFVYANPIYGCGHYNEGSCWTEPNPDEYNFTNMTKEDGDKWMKYWDPSNYLPNIKIPIHWVCGNIDHAYWPLILEASRKDCENYAHLHIKENLGHDHGINGETQEETRLLAEYYLKGGEKLVDIKSKLENNIVSFECDKNIRSAILFWTEDTLPNMNSKWNKIQIENKKSIEIPKEAKVYYVSIFDKNNLVTTSQIYKK